MKQPDIEDFISYKKRVGPSSLLEVGYPGSGKSVHGISITVRCLENKDIVLTHGDITCEWRHFLRYPKFCKGVKLLIPEKAEIQYKDTEFDKYKIPVEKHVLDFDKLNVMDYLQPQWVTVIFDDCFDTQSKTILWVEIARQLITRIKFSRKTITYLCHEAGNYYPQTAKKEQWKAIDEFCEYFVYFRKRNVRAILLSQLETEIYDRVRKKCLWKVYRLVYPANRAHAKKIKKYIWQMQIYNYHLFYGDLFAPLCENERIEEIRKVWLMIPRRLIKLNGHSQDKSPTNQKKSDLATRMIVNAYDTLESKRKVAKLLGIDRSTVNRHLERKIN